MSGHYERHIWPSVSLMVALDTLGTCFVFMGEKVKEWKRKILQFDAQALLIEQPIGVFTSFGQMCLGWGPWPGPAFRSTCCLGIHIKLRPNGDSNPQNTRSFKKFKKFFDSYIYWCKRDGSRCPLWRCIFVELSRSTYGCCRQYSSD